MSRGYNDEETINKAIAIFGNSVLNDFLKWYTYTLEPEWAYVVHIARRSYILALIMEKVSGKKMEEESAASFLTDSAFFLRCQELADYYRQHGRFPRILVCDDIMLHGRGINHTMEMMERGLCRILSDFKPEKVTLSFAEDVKVHVHTLSDTPLLLYSKYYRRMHFMQKKPLDCCHQFSSSISLLISRVNIANACYIFTKYLPEEQFARINDLASYTRTEYQRTVQYVKIDYVHNADKVLAVLSLRLTRIGKDGGYRAAPFVFLPKLDAEESSILYDKIVTNIPDEDCREWLSGLYEFNGKRTANELISLLLSNVLLQSFCETYDIPSGRNDYEQELTKLTRNYNQYGFEYTKQMLDRLLCMKLFTVSEMKDLLYQTAAAKSFVMKLEKKELTKPTIDAENIKQRIENYFYEKGFEDEKSAYKLNNMPYYRTMHRSIRCACDCCDTLAQLCRGYAETESKYCIAYFLQMMDGGVTGVSSYAPNHVNVAGFAQFAKAGEQALLIEPLRMEAYIPMLDSMQQVCSRWRFSFEQELDRYLTAFPQLYSAETVEKIQTLVSKLKQMGHTPSDWFGSYVARQDMDEAEALQHVYRQRELRTHYMAYADERIKNRIKDRIKSRIKEQEDTYV